MKKEVKLFDKKFVHFMWDGELEGKEGFGADAIRFLIAKVNNNERRYYGKVSKSKSEDNQFFIDCGKGIWTFFYYDLNYEVKWAYYKEGKPVQFKKKDCSANWVDSANPKWLDCNAYRIKPEEEKWCVSLIRGEESCCLASCEEDYKEIFRPFVYPHLQTKLFNEIEEMNKWLADISPDRIRDIKPMANPDALCWLVLYEERGDE